MKKIIILLLSAIFVLLTGCSANQVLDEYIMKKSGITASAEYMQYESYLQEGSLDTEGYYQEADSEGIQVTFAKNNNLDIKYYADKEHESLIEELVCTLLPGDKIYADVSVARDVNSTMYSFAGFRIYEYTEDGKRVRLSDIEAVLDEGQALVIPEDFEGKELSVEPVGEYQVREIKLDDYYVEDEVKHELDGTWLVDDKVYDGESAEINPTASYIISYQYDQDEYFFVSSIPECFYNNYEDGVVIFPQRDETDETINYSVELHKYVSVSLVSDADREVEINGGEKKSVNANTEIEINRLRYGEKVSLETNVEWSNLETYRDLILTSSEKLDNGNYKYSFTVPERGGEFAFDPSEYQYEHGTIQFKCFGSVVTNAQILAQGSRIYYEQKSAEDGYWLATGQNYIVVGDEEETKNQLRNIHFTPKVQVSVALSQPQYGGTIKYSVDGKQITDEEYSSYSGTVITMEFEPWEGWSCNATNGTSFVLGEERNQVIKVDGNHVNSIFVEDEEHKPKLTVVLDKSVGENMEFGILAPNVTVNSVRYTAQGLSSGKTIVDGTAIGTERGIEISMGNRAIETGKAVKIEAEIAGENKADNKTYLIYSDESTNHSEIVEVYGNGSNAYSKVWYESVEITISVVDVEVFDMPDDVDNILVTVQNVDTKQLLEEGNFVEADQRVMLTLTAPKGYYISDIKDDVYEKTMKYSEYTKSIEKIIFEHPAKKIYTITLDESDSYASYVYKLDGEEVSGEIEVREGQTLSLEYEILDDNYQLEVAEGGFLGIGKSYTKVSKDLKITSELDNKIVTKEDFGVAVVKGE